MAELTDLTDPELLHPTIEDLLAEAQAEIPRYTPREARDAVATGAVLVDIRPLEQRERDGLVPDAAIVDRNVLEWRLDPASPWRIPALARRDVPVILVCNEGYQSSLAALTLRRLGLDAGDVIGGVQRWMEEGLPMAGGVDDLRRAATANVASSDIGDCGTHAFAETTAVENLSGLLARVTRIAVHLVVAMCGGSGLSGGAGRRRLDVLEFRICLVLGSRKPGSGGTTGRSAWGESSFTT